MNKHVNVYPNAKTSSLLEPMEILTYNLATTGYSLILLYCCGKKKIFDSAQIKPKLANPFTSGNVVFGRGKRQMASLQ